MSYITLGIIGHVDHGKTTLVKALTGVDTDRLKEEKERGISIVLGYSHLELPDGTLGIIDAPGHEKFIRTMISGATGSDAVLLVVDVNEGVKPQTLEHLDIAELLGVKRGVIAITKCDTAEPDMRELAAEEVRELAEGTFLQDAPILPISATTGEGLDELRAELNILVRDSVPLPDEALFYLPIDRVFSMAGYGTIVTGTLRRGVLRVGDEVEICPQRIRAAVRDLQTHNEFVKMATPGSRVAVNLRNVDKSQLRRGNVLATPDTLTPSMFFDVHLRMLNSAPAPLKHGKVVRLLFGTQESFARIHLLDRDALEPGEATTLQLRVEEEVAVLNREPFIIRSYSPMRTIGGGTILGTSTGRYKRRDESVMRHMAVLAQGDPSDILLEGLRDAGIECIELESFARDHRITPDDLRALLDALPARYVGPEHAIHEEVYRAVIEDIIQTVTAFHKDNPTLRGLTKQQLSPLLKVEPGPILLPHALDDAVEAGTLRIENGLIRLADFDPGSALSTADLALAKEIEDAFKSGQLKPSATDETIGGDKQRMKIYRYLVDTQVLVPVHTPSRNKGTKNTVAFHRDVIQEAKDKLTGAFAPTGIFTTAEAKIVLDTTRKYLIPLLEHFDTTGFTKRSDEHRTIQS